MATDKAVIRPRRTIVALASAASLASACTTHAAPASETSSHVRITVGSKVFTATLKDNATARAFTALLPLTANMSELNGNEKLIDLADDLPQQASKPGTIHSGDLMLYGSNTVVLFYKTFSTPYSYTRIGKVDDVTGLAAALGSGSVTVRFER